jgi:hypothetical protein
MKVIGGLILRTSMESICANEYSREIAFDLLARLLAGERGEVPMQLALLLEKSSPLDHGEDHYRQILPAKLAELRIPPDTRDEIIAKLCAEVARNPDADLISASMSTGADLSVKTIVEVLTHPPRALKLSEYAVALSHATKFLPIRLKQNPEALPKPELKRLVNVVNGLKSHKRGDSDEDRSAGITIDHFAPQLLMSLERLGIEGR